MMRLHNGDCLNILKMMIEDEVFVDSIVTDPPYELGFMGRSWDYLRDLYLETRAQLNLDDNRTNKYQYRKAEKATVLFDSNNRTSHIK